jgi:acetolactate synthase I/III small subunit
VKGKGENCVEALRLADAFRARVIDASTESFVFELTGRPDKIGRFVLLMAPLGLAEVSQPTLGRLRKLARTGICPIARGSEEM